MVEPTLEQTIPPVGQSVRPTRLAALGRGLDRSLALLAGVAFSSQLLVATMLPILPLFAIELGASPIVLGLMVSVSAVAAAGGQLIGGVVSDRTGSRRLLPAGLVAYGTANILTSLASAAGPIVAWRGLAGLGTGAYIVGERLYIRDMVDRARLAFANGLIQAAGAAGFVIGPLLGGFVADASDLRTPIVLVGIGSMVVGVVALFLPARRRQDAMAGPATVEQVRTGRFGLIVLLLANTALAAGYGSFITTFAPFATDELLWTTAQIGTAFALFGLGNVVVGPWVGGAADRWGRRPIGALATIPIVGLAVALVLPTPDVVLFVLALAAGGGVAGFAAAWYALLSVATGGPRGGRAFGTVAAVSSLGVVVGALAAGQLWESIDIRAAMTVTIVSMALAGVTLAAYPGTPRNAMPAGEAEPP